MGDASVGKASGRRDAKGPWAAKRLRIGESSGVTYVVNVNSWKTHYPDCPSAKKTKAENHKETNESREELVDKGYKPCGNCNPL